MQSHHTGRYVAVVILLLLLAGGGYYFSLGGKGAGSKPNTYVPTPTPEKVQEAISEAESSHLIDISSCNPNPKVAKFRLGSQAVFQNQDSVAHTIAFSPTFKFSVPAKGRVTKSFDVWKYPGVRDYSCDKYIQAGSIYTFK